MKKVLTLLIVLVISFSMFSSIAFANDISKPTVTAKHTGVSGETTWKIEDGVLYIEGTGEMADYTNVGSDVAPWMEFRTEVTSVIIGDGITYIGTRAFKGMPNVTTVKFGAAVLSTGYECFQGCSAITSVELNDGITELGSNLFYGCESLETIDIPESVSIINTRVFKNCSKLNNVVLPEALSNSSYELFMGCTSLESINIPSKYTVISPAVFNGCTSLKEIIIPATVEKIRVQAFMNCTALETVIFEDEDTLNGGSDAKISSNAFEGCNSTLVLKSWMAGYVNDYAYRFGFNFEALNTSVFKYEVDADGNATITGMRGSMSSLAIPKTIDGHTVVAIGKTAFRYGTMKQVLLPSTVTSISGRAFQDCKNLTTVYGLEAVTKIDYSAFENCTNLTNVSFGRALTSIGAYAFQDCAALGEIYVPNTISNVNYTAFNNCTNAIIKTQENSAAIKAANSANLPIKFVTDFDYTINADGESVTVTGYLGNGGELIISKTIDNYNVTAIGTAAFRDVTSITSVSLPHTITTISGRAFQGCTGLTSVVIPQAVTMVDYSAFEDCTNLTEIIFWDVPNTIHNYAFNGCENLTFYGSSNSIIENFAIKNGYTFVAGRKYATYELPIININTNGQSITSKEDYTNMTFSIENCDDELFNITGGIRLRGNSTLKYPKKAYRIKFDKKQSLFGLEKAKSWVLLAEYIDPSNLHNYTAFDLASKMPGFDFVPTAHKVNIYLNGEFVGLYTLCEQIQENPGRVDIEMDEITETMVNLKDYNFLICMDSNVTEDPTAILDETYYYIPEHNLYFELKYPEKSDFVSDQQFDSFLSQLKLYTTEMLDAFYSRNLAKIKSDVNVESLIDFLIIDQIMGEVDHRSKSFYMYHTVTSSNQNKNGKLNFGPIWDYDFALYTEWTSKPNQYYEVSEEVFYSNVFYRSIVDIPEFYTKVAERYEQYALPALTDYIQNFDELVASMEESIELNNKIWYDSMYGSEISNDNIKFLKQFLIKRIEVLNKAWLGKD